MILYYSQIWLCCYLIWIGLRTNVNQPQLYKCWIDHLCVRSHSTHTDRLRSRTRATTEERQTLMKCEWVIAKRPIPFFIFCPLHCWSMWPQTQGGWDGGWKGVQGERWEVFHGMNGVWRGHRRLYVRRNWNTDDTDTFQIMARAHLCKTSHRKLKNPERPEAGLLLWRCHMTSLNRHKLGHWPH